MHDSQRVEHRSPLRLHKVVTAWHSLLQSVFHPYRPELYYMRGPGPKWHAKHDL